VTRQEVFKACRSGVAQVCLEQGRDRITAGSAFLVPNGIVTNSHVLRGADFDVAVIRFEDMDYAEGIRLARDTCLAAVAYESPSEQHDVAFLRLSEPEFAKRHVFTLAPHETLDVGDEIGFLGYPFQMQQLTCHVGYVSSLHAHAGVNVIQIDGSVNGGNSGGPLIELTEGRVLGVVSRAEIGFLADQFDHLIRTLKQNVDVLQRVSTSGTRMTIGGVDPVQGLLASQTAMLQIAANLRRSANVGIGYAFRLDHLQAHTG
jgi:S1-C subfamily serine protease